MHSPALILKVIIASSFDRNIKNKISLGFLIVFLIIKYFCIFPFYLGANPLTAITWNAIINILLEGILQPIFAAVVAFIVCPIGAFAIAIGAFIRKGFRDAWDAVLFQVYIIRNVY